MAIGERIRFMRNLRGMTQRWLGQAVGFPAKTADIRMAQYESGTRTPKEDLVNALANVLEVSPLALKIPDIDSDLGFIHTLFAIEDIQRKDRETRFTSFSMAASGIWMRLFTKCCLPGLNSLKSSETVRSAKSSTTIGVTRSPQRTPHKSGEKYPRRNLAMHS